MYLYPWTPFQFLHSIFYNFSNMSSTTTSTPSSFKTFSKTHYPPPVLIKHYFWYLDNANLFISIWGTLYGIHCTYFEPFHYFQNILDCIDPMFTISQGYLPKQPILFNNLNTQLFSHLLSYLYQPTLFERTWKNWESIRNISKGWDFLELTYIAVWNSMEIWFQELTPTHQGLLQWFITNKIVA